MTNHRKVGLLASSWLLVLAACALAQQPSFHPLLTGHRIAAGAGIDGLVYAGLERGGVLEFDPATATIRRSLDRATGLGGHFVQDIAWSGSRLLIAFGDGGITAISNPGTASEFIQLYRDGLSSLDVTCVSGQLIGGSERIWYGTEGNGIGVIDGGREGVYLSTLDGLIDDQIDDVALSGALLLVATPTGLSRFVDNAFENYTYADLGWPRINDLEVAADGQIWAATQSGVKRWNDQTRTLDFAYSDVPFVDLAADGNSMLALTVFGQAVLVRESDEPAVPLPDPPAGESISFSAMIPVDDEVWVGGHLRRDDLPAGTLITRSFLAPAGGDVGPIHELATCPLGIGGGFDGTAFDAQGRAWVADRTADGLGGWNGSSWYIASDLAGTSPDSSGFYDYSGDMLAMTRSGEDLWFYQYTRGAVRFRPAAEAGGEEQWDLIDRFNSGMRADGVVAMASHPDGAVFFCSDAAAWWEGAADNPTLGIDVLFDSDRPHDPASWYQIPPSLLEDGNVILAAAVQRRDVVWFAVQNVGLLQWDINGLGAGPDDPLTWGDPTDDYWSEAVAGVPGSSVDLSNPRAIAFDGETIWAGGAGLVRFEFAPGFGASLRGQWTQKSESLVPGLLGQVVRGLAFDHNGDLWILSDKGLDRFQISGDVVTVSAYTDLVSFGDLDQRFYSSSAIAPLPGGTYRDLAISADQTALVLTCDLGAVMLDVPRRGGEAGEALASAFLYPNPFTGETGDGRVKIGGLTVDEANPASIEVLNLVGQIVYRRSRFTGDGGFWDGRNRLGERVASGMYVVKIEQAGAVRVVPLAVAF